AARALPQALNQSALRRNRELRWCAIVNRCPRLGEREARKSPAIMVDEGETTAARDHSRRQRIVSHVLAAE
ncbi:MAG: hypothetical protein ACREEP_04825, partial [Dongiaceae bacterium]